MDSKKKKNLEESYERILNVGFCKVPYEDLSDIIGPNPMVFGTAKDEKILSFEGLDALLKSQFEQKGDMESVIDRKRIAMRISNDGNNAFIVEEITLTLSSPEAVHTIFMRATCVMEYLDNQWKLTHWHTSSPVDTENDPWHLEEWKREKEKLQQLVDLQTAELKRNNRELQIEAALERVRAKAMAMQKSEGLRTVVVILYDQLKNLGFQWGVASIVIMDPDSGDMDWWMEGIGDGFVLPERYHVPFFEHPGHLQQLKHWKNGTTYAEIEILGEDKKTYDDYYYYQTDFSNAPESSKQLMMQHEAVRFSMAFMKYGALSWSPTILSKEQANILERFAKVLEQCYTRFLDLQKAESQAREAQIEAALERVRTSAMVMHKSDDLKFAVATVFEELEKLNLGLIRCGIAILDKEKPKSDIWITVKSDAGSAIQVAGDEPLDIHPLLKGTYDAWRKQEDFSYVLQDDDLLNYYQAIAKTKFQLPFSASLNSENKDQHQYFFNAVFHDGSLFAFLNIAFTDEAKTVMKRFANVFNLTYKRFLDLQKAESQAREAQIEAALERVRSKTMAMHSSADVDITVITLFDELLKLGVDKSIRSGIGILDKSKRMEVWTASTNPSGQTALDKGVLDMASHQLLTEVQEAWEAKKPTHSYELIGDDLIKYFKAINDAPGYSLQVDLEKLPGKIIHYDFFFPEGVLFAFSPTPLSDEISRVFMRFASVFGQTYRRFLDLQKAEAQAREATKQASLDRVRGIIASMRSAADLDLITPLIFKELTILGVPFIRCGVFIIDEKQELVNAYLSSPDGNSLGVLKLPYHASELTQGTVDAWRKGEVYRQHWNKEDFIHWINLMMEMDQIQDSNTYQGAAAPPESLDLHFVPFTQGMLYVGAVSPLDEKELELAMSLAKAFSIAYARYEDFEKLDTAKSDIESALSELKATQSQLVQQEKLASLGQLTAGIAHEIKNPLNFVNNFSEVSIEMIEESMQEMEKREARDETLIKDNLEDIRSNLQKIHEHGSRANGIVTSMLQHSRGGSGQKEPTELNALIKEYVNLSYHGMRAGKNPINVEIDFNLDPAITNVSIIKEDFIRVIINLCNNAFDAMRGKVLKTQDARHKMQDGAVIDESYLPKLKVTTSLDKGQVRVAIQDNGPGIPDDIKDKILQPFFTTKKGTEGTGLGLSITHDIIKAHGGEMKVESEVGKGSEFIIILMVPKNPGI
jgi:signal transduction histidine kinase